jgi:RimJ/RimL family protein N-acetyltransferase
MSEGRSALEAFITRKDEVRPHHVSRIKDEIFMDITTSLYEGKLVRLGPVDFEKDPQVESKWTHDSEYLRLTGARLGLPASVERIKKKCEAIEKAMDEAKNIFHFAIRLRAEDGKPSNGVPSDAQPTSDGAAGEPKDGKPAEGGPHERLLGFAVLEWVSLANGNAYLRLAIGNPADRRKGYGSDTLRLLLRYAFGELNLHRVSVNVPAYNTAALAFFQKFGFVEELRRRKALQVDGQTWDALTLGLLREEWNGNV